MATGKQKKALEILVESGGKKPVSKAMVEAGYSEATAKTPQKLTESEAYKALFPIDKTAQVVENLHKLSIAAQDEKTQLEASKEWLNRTMGKGDNASGNVTVNFNQLITDMKDRYDD